MINPVIGIEDWGQSMEVQKGRVDGEVDNHENSLLGFSMVK
jgi:hypothetical protein